MNKEKMWEKLCEVAGEDITSATKKLYSLYTPNTVDWFASLYAPGVGGFYYSNSARDNATVI